MAPGSERQVARNFVALASGEALSRVVAFCTTVYLARVLGAGVYGMVAFAASVNLYLGKVADFGIESIGAQEIARSYGAEGDQPALARLISSVLSVRLALTVLLVAASITVMRLFVSPPQRDVLSLYFLLLLPIAASTKWVHMGQHNARPIGITRVIGELLALAIVATTVRSVDHVWLVPVAQLVGDSLVALALARLLMRSGLQLRLRWDLATAAPIFKRALPLTAQALLGLIIYNSDIMFLRTLRDSASVGYYASAYTLVSFLVSVGVSHGTSLLPALSRLESQPEAERALFQGALARTFAAAFPVVVGGSCVASGIIELAFGHGYAPSSRVLQILIWSVLASAARSVCIAALIAHGNQRLLLRTNVYGVVLNLLLNTILITRYGMLGAAVSTVVTESFGFLWVALRYAPQLGLGSLPLARFARPFLAGIAMGAAVLFVPSWLLPFQIALGGIVYVACLWAFGVIKLRKGALPSLHV